MKTETHDVLPLRADHFQAEVLENSRPVLIDFWAPWCGPCRMLKPMLQEAASALGDAVDVRTVNVDEEPGLAQAFHVQGIPYLVVMQGNRALTGWSGVAPAAEIVRRVQTALAAPENSPAPAP